MLYADGRLSWNNGQDSIDEADIITVINNVAWSLSGVAGVKLPELQSTYSAQFPTRFQEAYGFQKIAVPACLPFDNRHDTTHTTSPTIHILISTHSGTQLATDFFNLILRPLLDEIGMARGDYNVVQTSTTTSIQDFAREVLFPNATAGREQSILLLSGDGGTVDIINELNRSKSALNARYVATRCAFVLLADVPQACIPCQLYVFFL